MNPELVPAVDPMALPAPAWLFHVLLVFTFFLHALFMNLTLGGTILAAVGRLMAGNRAGDHRGVLADRLVGINTYGISLTITTGIAPLLFIQLLYQQYFYSATILIGWVWLGFLVMLMAGYYAVYVYKFKGAPARGHGGGGWLVVAAVMFFLISMVHVAVNLTHAQPDTWAALAENPWGILRDPAYVPRLLHFVFASLGFSALVVAWWAVRQARAGEDTALNAKIARFGWRWALWTTLAQVLDGFILLLVLPREVLLGLIEGGIATMAPLTVGILLGIGLLAMLSRVSEPVEKPGLVGGTLGAMLLTIAIMSVTRHQVRALYLEPVSSNYELVSAPQWGNFVLFAVLLVAGLGVVGYMVREVLRNPAKGAEAA
jgi:hypothetical protein